MQRYRYKHGDRPLEGYTIQRAAGYGGFGEVYYALSDSGREVAIKAVQNYEQIELRGISQCMNLKSPHLVTIFDVKYNQHNEPFVIMEYVSGPSLHDLLLESPGGLGAQKSAFFLREIAKGLSYLHDCGIVHRDLKPSNIFYENGYVKVGDYGLTKSITASRHSGHTITVGTVHYMAPEVGTGNYSYSIDIYALGVLLYEMLTGKVPFMGGSPAEILMKHMTADPELDEIDEPFAHVIKKALAKDPNGRYKSVQEMVEDLFGSENIRNSVSHFSPDELSIVAERVAAKVAIGQKLKSDKPVMDTAAPGVEGAGKESFDHAQDRFSRTAKRFTQRAEDIGRSVADKVDAKVNKILGAKKTRIPGITDPILPRQRHILVFTSMIIVAIGAGLLQAGNNKDMILPTTLIVFAMIGVCAKAMLFSQRRWFGNLESQSQWPERLATCGLASFLAALLGALLLKFLGVPGTEREIGLFGRGFRFPLGFFGLGYGPAHTFSSTWFSLLVPMLLVDWRRIISPDRAKRLSLGSALWVAMLGAIAAAIFSSNPIVIAAVLAGTSLVVQTASSFGETEQNITVKHPKSEKQRTQFQRSLNYCAVPTFLRVIFLAVSFITLGIGLFLLILAGIELRGEEYALAVAFGINSLILSVFFFIGFCRRKFTGWYRYLIKPAILLICVLTIITSAVCMGCMNLGSDEFAVALFFIIFPALTFILIAVIPASAVVGRAPRSVAPPVGPQLTPQLAPGVSSFKRLWALLLSAAGLFGFCGLQRFYVGKIGTGILWFLTWGIFGIGQLIDVIMIIVGQFKDRYGLPLVVWQDKDEIKNKKDNVKVDVQPSSDEYKAPAAMETPVNNIRPAAIDNAPKLRASNIPATVIIREPFHPFAFLCSGIGFILIFLAIVLGIIVGLQTPYFIAAGWPDQHLASELEQFFGYSSWPVLLVRLGTIATYTLFLLAAVFIILGRRHLGARHLIRALLGFLGLILAFSALSDASSGLYYNDVVNLLNSQQYGPAIERLLQSWQNETAFIALIFFLVSIVILAWPPRRKQTVITAMPNQGVS